MKAKKTPERMCVACGQMKAKKELIRIVRNEEGIFPDPGGKASGRGAYLCRNAECFGIMMKKHALDRAFKVRIADERYRELGEALKELL